MEILSRKLAATKETSRKGGPGRRVHRRIEITVEREIVSVLVRDGQAAATGEPAQERQECTFLIRNVGAETTDVCPVCGGKLVEKVEVPARPQLND